MSENSKTLQKISRHEFYFETPLYDSISLDQLENDFLEGEVDAYSSKNKIDTTYAIDCTNMHQYNSDKLSGYFRISLTCKRKGDDDIIWIFVYIADKKIVKIGQNPSLADIQFAEIGKKYDKLLDQDSLKEFKKAIGLAAHGVGAGSFVYLRRIFEKLIWVSFEENKAAIAIDAAAFLKQRMDEKIQTLEAYLPSQLVKMQKIYVILSKGVHELEEQECLEYFPAIKLSIELILRQKIEMEAKKKDDDAAQKQIEEIAKKLTQDK